MKWITIAPLMILLSACILTEPDMVEKKEVIVTPPNEKPTLLAPCSSMDVTTTKISGSRQTVLD